MSDKKDNQGKAYSGLELLRDLFAGTGTNKAKKDSKEETFGISSLVDVIPAFITELSKQLKLKEVKDEQECDDKQEKAAYIVKDSESPCKVKKTVYGFTSDGKVMSTVTCYGIDKSLCDDDDRFMEWAKDIYRDAFISAYKTNCGIRTKHKCVCVNEDEKFCISELRFNMYCDGDSSKTNLAYTPWYWDSEMRSFYFVDEEGAHYVRFIVKDDDVDVCTENNCIMTDIITPDDREMFVKAIKGVTGKKCCKNDNLSEDGQSNDDLSYKTEDKCCGAEFDNNAQEISDNYTDECDIEECEEKENHMTLVDMVSDNGYVVDGYAIRELGDNEYSSDLKKLYKDILCMESNIDEKKLDMTNLIRLFKYMLDHRKFEHGYINDSTIAVVVSYEDMMDNIDKLTDPIIDPAKSKLPWFMNPGHMQIYSKLFWNDFDHKVFATKVREWFNFDEVLLVDMEVPSNEGKDSQIKHCIICSFEAM